MLQYREYVISCERWRCNDLMAAIVCPGQTKTNITSNIISTQLSISLNIFMVFVNKWGIDWRFRWSIACHPDTPDMFLGAITQILLDCVVKTLLQTRVQMLVYFILSWGIFWNWSRKLMVNICDAGNWWLRELIWIYCIAYMTIYTSHPSYCTN